MYNPKFSSINEEIQKKKNHSTKMSVFTESDIEQAIKACNFNTGIGPDKFCGLMLINNQVINSNFKKWAVEVLNGDRPIPNYLSEGRLVVLSKTSSPTVSLDQTRPIIVMPHITRILEKAMSAKLQESKSELLQTGDYQTGFKEGMSTQKNLSIVMHNILETSRARSKREILLFFDLNKAFDRVLRPALWQILLEKAKTDVDKLIIERLCQLHNLTSIRLNDGSSFTSNQGCPQGGVLSPNMFNVYLQNALEQNETLNSLITQGRLVSFADDIMVRVETQEQAIAVIEAMESLQKVNLTLNKSKSQILHGPTCLENKSDLAGIPIVKTVKYLGYSLASTKTKLLHYVQQNVKKHMAAIRAKIKLTDETVQKILTAAYGRSLLTYFGTPQSKTFWHSV